MLDDNISYNLAIIAPYEQLKKSCDIIANKVENCHITVCEGIFNDAGQKAVELERQGVDVIISRGATTDIIREKVKVPVVDILTDDQDLIYALYEGSKLGSKLAIVTSPQLVFKQKLLESLLDIEIHHYSFMDQKKLGSIIEKVKNRNLNIVVGGVHTVFLAKKAGLHGILIQNSEDAIVRAIKEAINIAKVKHKERLKAQYFRTILDYSQEGIIAINEAEEITVFNKSAQKILDKNPKMFINKSINSINYFSDLTTILKTGQAELGKIIEIDENTCVFANLVPIKISEKTSCAIATFKDVTYLQKLERKIREKLHARGHVAKHNIDDIMGKSQKLSAIKEKARLLAKTDSTILISGESGTGKEMFAHAIHNLSKRNKGPFVAINCSAIPENLIESELFGYEGGSFTGAREEGKPGLFLLAHGGTIFLDEIDSISKKMQSSLLRVLQEREIRPVGSQKIIPVDVRIIAATNSNLSLLVEQDRFRADLYYRLNVLNLYVPPLRERKEDIPELLIHFLKFISNRKDIIISQEAIKLLTSYKWPGNIRELINVAERLVVTVDDQKEIDKHHILAALPEIMEVDKKIEVNIEGKLEDIKYEIILKTLRAVNGHKTIAAEKLDISRVHLWRLLKDEEKKKNI